MHSRLGRSRQSAQAQGTVSNGSGLVTGPTLKVLLSRNECIMVRNDSDSSCTCETDVLHDVLWFIFASNGIILDFEGAPRMGFK